MSQAPPDKQQQQKQKKHKKKRKSKQAPSETQETEEQPGSTYTRPRDLASRSDWLFCAHSGDCLVEQPETERFCSPWGPTYSVPLDGGACRHAAFGFASLALTLACADITHHTRIVESDMEVRTPCCSEPAAQHWQAEAVACTRRRFTRSSNWTLPSSGRRPWRRRSWQTAR